MTFNQKGYKMEVDFNNLRKQAAFAYDRLAKTLNNNIKVGCYGQKIINVDAEEIETSMEDLRRNIIFICGTHEPGDEKFADVLSDMKDIEWFNHDTSDN